MMRQVQTDAMDSASRRDSDRLSIHPSIYLSAVESGHPCQGICICNLHHRWSKSGDETRAM